MKGNALPVGIDSEGVSFKPREHVKVAMEYFLEGSFTIGEEHIYSFALQTTAAEGPGESVSYTEHFGPYVRLTSSR